VLLPSFQKKKTSINMADLWFSDKKEYEPEPDPAGM
jgi:hypothetical protein